MNHTEKLTRYTANFVDELVKNGLFEVVISPGSRSAPLAMTVSEHEGIREWVIIDERSAAFFALGMAKETGRPVALICTSGSAVANYFPAIVEAYHSRTPLVILTADRPPELRDIGAPQAIEQIKIFGEYVKWFHEMALPEGTPQMLNYARSKAARSIHIAQDGNAGPVHLNFPFREPLIPDFTLDGIWSSIVKESYNPLSSGEKKLSAQQLHNLLEKLKGKRKGIIVCGPQIDAHLAESIVKLASKWGLPVLADPLSQLRAGQHAKDNIIENYDAILRNEFIRHQLKADFIIRFGAMPVSKSFLFFIQEQKNTTQFLIEDTEGYRDPEGNSTEYVYAEANMLCEDLLTGTSEVENDPTWLKTWQQMNYIAMDTMLEGVNDSITEGNVVGNLLKMIEDNSKLFVGNSMAVRDLDSFFMTTDKNITILSNRGTSGIDGVVSSALGAAATSETPVTLLIGDLSLYHDLNGLLMAKHYKLNLTILLVNNDGGGIFSFLPQAKHEKHFESLFGTPLDIEFEQAIKMYGGKYSEVNTIPALCEALSESYACKGLSVIEVKTDRVENHKWHQDKWEKVEQRLLNNWE